MAEKKNIALIILEEERNLPYSGRGPIDTQPSPSRAVPVSFQAYGTPFPSEQASTSCPPIQLSFSFEKRQGVSQP